MDHNSAVDLMKKCARSALEQNGWFEGKGYVYNECHPFSELHNIYQVDFCIDSIAYALHGSVREGCAEGVGYILNIERFPDSHPAYIFATIYSLLVADADIYVLYDGSYITPSKKYDASAARFFLDEFFGNYEKVYKIIVADDSTDAVHKEISDVIKGNDRIKHIVDFGDFVNFHNKADWYKSLGLRVHLPAAHYLIMDYSAETVSFRQKQLLTSFGAKCVRGMVDYAAYSTIANKHSEYYGFDLSDMFSDAFSMYYCLEEIDSIADKVMTVIFTDKDESELNLPARFRDRCDVILSDNYNDNVIYYDFSQLFD